MADDRSQNDRDRNLQGSQGGTGGSSGGANRDQVGRGADVPDSTQVPWNAERGEPDLEATNRNAGAGQRDQSSRDQSTRDRSSQRDQSSQRDRSAGRDEGMQGASGSDRDRDPSDQNRQGGSGRSDSSR